MSYNKFKNTELKDLNNLGFALRTGVINLDVGSSGKCIDLGAGDTTRPSNSLYGTIQYNNYGGVVIFGHYSNQRVDIFNNLYVHGNLTIDASFTVNEIVCPTLFAQSQNLTLNSSEGNNIFINYYKPTGPGNVIINRSCNESNCHVYIENGNLYMKNNANGTIYCNQIKDYNNYSYLTTNSLGSSVITFSNVLTTNYGITNSNYRIYNNSQLYQADNMFMSNASYIYLKNNTDVKHYLKYDATYDGPQLGFVGGLTFKYNATTIVLNATSTAMNIYTNTAITGNLSASGSSSLGSLSCTSLTSTGNLNVSGQPIFGGTNNQTLPSSSTGGLAGLSIYWNTSGSSHGETTFLNMAQAGDGGFSFYSSSNTSNPKKLMYLDSTSNLSCSSLTTNNITNNGTLSNSGSASFNSVSTTSINNSGSLIQAGPIEVGPNSTNFTCIDMKTAGGNSDYDIRIGVTGGSSATSGQGALSFNCASCSIGSNLAVTGNVTCNTLNATSLNVSSGTNITCNSFNGSYINNIKCYTVKGYSFKTSSVNINNVFAVYPGNTTVYSNSVSLTMDDTCWSISILFNYYTTGSALYQGSKQYMIIKYGDGTWIFNSGTVIGSVNCQPTFTISGTSLNISHSQATNTGDTIYMYSKIEMY